MRRYLVLLILLRNRMRLWHITSSLDHLEGVCISVECAVVQDLSRFPVDGIIFVSKHWNSTKEDIELCHFGIFLQDNFYISLRDITYQVMKNEHLMISSTHYLNRVQLMVERIWILFICSKNVESTIICCIVVSKIKFKSVHFLISFILVRENYFLSLTLNHWKNNEFIFYF